MMHEAENVASENVSCELSFTFCDFDTVAFFISTVVIHRMLTLISEANLQWCMGYIEWAEQNRTAKPNKIDD